MRARHTLSLAITLAALGCGQSHTADGDAGRPTPVPDGGDGVCCPVSDFFGCSPGGTPLPGGGWAASPGACSYAISGWDGRPYVRQLDEHGCPILRQDPTGCCGCPPDAGPPPSDCDGLAPAACLGAGCVPDFDDSCCSTCEPTGGCADCVSYDYHSCQPLELACLGGSSCGVATPWGCGPVADECDAAHAVDLDSCDRVGCVPAYPSSEGAPDLATAICVPIQATSCTVACRRLAPPCPPGTTAEGDGSCYTDRCIPSFVCG